MNGNVGLNKSYVQFPHKNLDIAPYCPFAIELKYRLTGVIEHIGTQQGGHYIAAKRIADESGEKWILCNDEIVRPIRIEKVLKCKAYMLFYEQMDE